MKTVSRKFTNQKGQGSIRSYASLGLLVVCILVLLIVPMLRPDSNPLIGEESFLNMRLANNFNTYDQLSYGGRFAAYYLGLPFILSFLSESMALLLPFILGVLSFILFGLILDEFEVNGKKMAMLLLAVSPPFIYLFSTINNYFVAVFLALLGFYLFNNKNKFFLSLAIGVFMLMPFFNFVITIITGVLLLLLASFKLKSKRKYAFVAVALMYLVGLLYFGYLYFSAGNPFNYYFSISEGGFNTKMMAIFSDLGGAFGLGTFSVILAVFGLIKVWKRKYKELFAFFAFLFLVILIFFRSESLFVFNFFIVLFAAKGLNYLYHKQWFNQMLRNLTLFVLVCGLVFSCLSFVNELKEDEPTLGIVQGLEYLSTQKPGVVFAHPTRGKWINYAKKANVMDTNYHFAPNVYERWDDTNRLLHTRDMNEALEIIDKYDIKYVWVDSGYKAQVWSHDEDGLLFLLRYGPHFKRLYNQDDVQIWKVVKVKPEFLN